jgi:tetraacyldisaccharide 4'-kinase
VAPVAPGYDAGVASLRAIQSGRPGLLSALGRVGLHVLSWGFRLVASGRRALYRMGALRTRRLPVPVVCVGNIVAGGTGKTPFVIWLVRRMRAAGRSPGVLARGYGAPSSRWPALNDEGAVLAEALGDDLPQGQGADRFRAGTELLGRHPDVDVLVLDDGFQHHALARDLDVVLVDATRPFGYGHPLPRGLLREPPRELARAGAVVITRAERVTGAALDRLRLRLGELTRAPLAVARTLPADGVEEELRGARVLALCGIGNPQAFEGTLADLGAQVVARRELPDHASLGPGAWPDVLVAARAAGAECVVMTRKDAVKHAALPPEVTVVDVEIEIVEGEAALWDAVRHAIGS